MKTLAYLILLFFCCENNIFSQIISPTILYDYGSNTPLRNIDGNKQRVCIVVGNNSIVLRTSDGGRSWSQLTTFRGFTIVNVLFFDDYNCIVVGSKGNTFSSFYSSDAGETWNQSENDGLITSTQSSDFNSLKLTRVNTGKCLVISAVGLVVESDDYGKTWRKTSSFDGVYRLTNSIVSQNDTIIHSFRGDVYYRSTDGGKTWMKMPPLIIKGNITSALATKNVIKVTVNVSSELKIQIFESTDNGESWSQILSDTSLKEIDNVSFMDTSSLIAYRTRVDPGFFISKDYGKTWNSYGKIEQSVQFYNAYPIVADSLIVIGDRKSILTIDLKTNTSIPKSLIKYQSKIASVFLLRQRDENSIVFCESNWSAPTISTDLGGTWKQNEHLWGLIGNVTDIFFRNSKSGYLIGHGQPSMFYETSDGGETWQNIGSKLGKSYSSPHSVGASFSFTDENNGIAFVKNNDNINSSILHTNNGGSTWSELDIDSVYKPLFMTLKRNDVQEVIYAIADYFGENSSLKSKGNIIAKSSDYGKSWVNIHIMDSLLIHGMHVYDDSNIIIAGRSTKKESANNRRILRTTDAGSTWLNVLSDKMIAFPWTLTVEKNICIAGCHEYDSLIISTDSGFTWNSLHYRPVAKIDQIKYTLFDSFIHNKFYYASGRINNTFLPNPDDQNSAFIMKCELPFAPITSTNEIENTDPFARVWIFDVVPNPVTRRTRISLFCDPSVKQSLSVGLFNVQGMLVKDLTSDAEITPTGHGYLNFEADGVSSGMYLLKISGGGTTRTQLIAVIQ